MKKIISQIMIIALFLSMMIPVNATGGATIIDLSASIDSSKNVKVEGKISTGNGVDVTLKILDPNNGIERIDQKKSTTADGGFEFSYKMTNILTGTYTVFVGGTGVATQGVTSFVFNGSTPTPTVTPTPTITPTPTATLTPVASVKINKKTAALKVTQSLQLSATVLPSNAAIKSVKWTTSNYKVATVSSTGKVTAKARGTATITVTTVSGLKKATCKVTVTQPVKSVKLSKKSLILKKGKTYKLVVTISPSNASNRKVIWKTGSKKIATVSTSGKITAKTKGTVYITVTTVDGKKTAKCKLIIK